MPSTQIIKLEQTLKTYSPEDKKWLMEQLKQQLQLTEKKNPSNLKQEARELIAETLSEVLNLPDHRYEEVWGNFDAACLKITNQLESSDFV
ncbi:MAG: hypothetical protein ACRC6M_02755 [Microcystaceae cyanobacterium]